MRNREGFWVTETERECTKCHILFERTSKTVTLCNLCNSKRVKAVSPEWKMHQRAKQRATISGREFSITPEDIHIPLMCPVLGVPLKVTKGKSGAFPNSPSLDRIDNDRGYISGNIRVVSQRANRMKGDASKDELLAFAEWIKETYGEDN